jgi:hypothetical protein
MYTEEDRELANDILNEVKRSHRKEESELYVYLNDLFDKGIDNLPFEDKCKRVWEELASMGLLSIEKGWMSLTSEGHLAADMGVEAYLAKYKENRELEVESKQTTIWNNKVQIVVGITSLLSFIAGVLLSDPIKNLWNHISDKF